MKTENSIKLKYGSNWRNQINYQSCTFEKNLGLTVKFFLLNTIILKNLYLNIFIKKNFNCQTYVFFKCTRPTIFLLPSFKAILKFHTVFRFHFSAKLWPNGQKCIQFSNLVIILLKNENGIQYEILIWLKMTTIKKLLVVYIWKKPRFDS